MPGQAKERALHAVEAAPAAPVKPPARPRLKSVAQATATGSELEVMEALRRRLAKMIDNPKCSSQALAALTRQMLDMTERIQTLKGGGPSGDDDAKPDAPADVDEEWDPEAL